MIDSSKLSDLNGKTVIGRDGDGIGKVKDVYESTDGSGGTFATVSTGLFGSGASFFPLDAAELRDGKVVVPFDKDVIKDARRVENDEELTAPEEQRLFAYYAGIDGARGTVGHSTSGATTGDAMTRSEEKLHVGTEKVETGRARLRKRVVTETETRTVPVSHEELRVERVRLDKQTVTERATVTEDVRKEQIDLDGAADVYPSDGVTDAQKAEQRK